MIDKKLNDSTVKNSKNPCKTNIKYVIIDAENQKQRLDNFIYNEFKKLLPRSIVQEIIRTGQVRVNKCRVRHNYRLEINDQVRIPPVKLNHLTKEPTSQLTKDLAINKKLKIWQAQLEKAIIFENSNILIINKPAGLAVHGGSKIKVGLVEIMKTLRKTEPFIELVHRLDRDTSGCIMLAKKRSYLKKLHLLLKERKITKKYISLVKGQVKDKKVIELQLKKFIKNSKEHMVKVVENGSYAKTICLPGEIFKHAGQYSSLVTVNILTGKTHQIRVHLSNIGLPIANDDKYGDRDYNLIISKLGLNRMFLHASCLEFICPDTTKKISVTAPYDENLTNFLLKIRGMTSEL